MNKIVYEPKLGCNIPMFVPEYLLKIINCFKKTSNNGMKECECFKWSGKCKAWQYCFELSTLVFDYQTERIKMRFEETANELAKVKGEVEKQLKELKGDEQ